MLQPPPKNKFFHRTGLLLLMSYLFESLFSIHHSWILYKGYQHSFTSNMLFLSLLFFYKGFSTIHQLQTSSFHHSQSSSSSFNFLPCQVNSFYNSSNQQALLQTILRSSSFLKIHLSSLVFSLAEGVENKGLSKI